jgi:hypothetical protein
VTDALNAATFQLSVLSGHVAVWAGQAVDLAVAHPVITFQILAVLSIAMHRRGSQI